MKPLKIQTRDGYQLGATLFEVPGAEARGTVVINSAMAVPQRLYAAFAAHLSSYGYDVVTYDYRGIGQSRPTKLRGFKADVLDWAKHDQGAVLDWAAARGKPVRLVCHSIGGQLVGLAPPHSAVRSIVMFAAQTGYWRSFAMRNRYAYAVMFFGLIPLLARAFGYFPASRLGLGEDTPAAAVRQWAHWCRSPGYFDGAPGVERLHFSEFKVPVTSCSFSDDPMAPARNVDAITALFAPGVAKRVHLDAANGHGGRIGHFGFFSSSQRERLWDRCLEWIETG